MKTSFAAIAFSMASVAYSQSITDLPSCSLDCFVSVLGGDGCSSLTDFECHCKVSGLTDEITPCVKDACSTADQQTVITQVQGICEQYGISLSVPVVSSTVAPSSAASSAPASSAAATTAETTSEASATASATESSAGATITASTTETASPSATDVVISTPVATPTTPGSGASTPAGGATVTPSQFEGAAPTVGVFGGVVGLAVAVVAAAGL